ncbi:MAG TPA: DUF1501 domain-containing protein [Acidimicrobiales bacterium]|nr:DUF1501 domain-containing protein [Acidimicrobiales bacterium]
MSLSRRQFLLGAAGAAAAGTAGVVLAKSPWEPGSPSPSPAAGAGAAAQPTSPPGPGPAPAPTGKGGILVVVTLYGGNDGLNTLIPYQAGQYLGGRPDLGYKPDEVIPLDDGLALHQNLKGLKGMWDQGRLAVVRGVGYPNPNRSHFRSMDIWQTASPENGVVTGWLGRWLDRTGDDPLRAVSVGDSLPRLLAGERVAGSSVPVGSLTLPGSAAVASGFAALSRPVASGSGLGNRVAQTGADLLAVNGRISELLATLPPAGSAGTPTGPGLDGTDEDTSAAGALGTQLDLVAKLIKAGSDTKAYSVSLGGFDTHANEKDTHARLMGQLDAAVTAFFRQLGTDGRAGDVVLMTYSEFGRRVAANASGGTDHGTAGPVFVAGPHVKGGFYGDEPSLTDLDQGDLRFTTDFRSIYATMLGQVIGVDPTVSLAKGFPPLPFV